MTDADQSRVDRRRMLRLSGTVAGATLLTAATQPTPVSAAPAAAKIPITPPEDLMREHGVVKRVLLVYCEIMRRLDEGMAMPRSELHATAGIVRSFVEDYHELLEEQYVFPKLMQVKKLGSTVSTLHLQHRRGRALTDHILSVSRTPAKLTTAGRRRLVGNLAAFITMYNVHEAREDTVVFPVFREVVPARTFNELGKIFQEKEDRRFGTRGFGTIVDEVADIEKALGIHDLAKFTPPPA